MHIFLYFIIFSIIIYITCLYKCIVPQRVCCMEISVIPLAGATRRIGLTYITTPRFARHHSPWVRIHPLAYAREPWVRIPTPRFAREIPNPPPPTQTQSKPHLLNPFIYFQPLAFIIYKIFILSIIMYILCFYT